MDLIKKDTHVQSLTNDLTMDLDEQKPFKEKVQDAVEFMTTQNALNDEQLVNEITELKKEEIKENVKADLTKGQAKNKNAEKELQKSIFGVYEGLAQYIGLKNSLPKTMFNILMFFLQPILGIVFLVNGFIVGIINITMDGINSIVEKFSEFTKYTKRAVLSLFIIALVVIVLIIINYILNQFGIFLL